MTNHWIDMRAAAEYVGPRRRGPDGKMRPTHPDTVERWCVEGLGGRILYSELRGGKRMTTIEYVDLFFRQLNQHAQTRRLDRDEEERRDRTPAQRQKDHERAERHLRGKGALSR